jgi:hypothetical protein
MEDVIYFCGQCHSEVHRRADVCPHCNAIKGCRLTDDGIVQTRGDLVSQACRIESLMHIVGAVLCGVGLVIGYWLLIPVGLAAFFCADPLARYEIRKASASSEYWYRSKAI